MSVAAGTSMTMYDTFLALAASATWMGSVTVCASGSYRMNAVLVSATTAESVVEWLISAIPAWLRIFQEAAMFPVEPSMTATTPSRTIWLAQSTSLPGSLLVMQTSRSIGCPARPLCVAFSQLAAARATGSSALPLQPWQSPPVVSNPTFTRVPVALPVPALGAAPDTEAPAITTVVTTSTLSARRSQARAEPDPNICPPRGSCPQLSIKPRFAFYRAP